MISESVYAADGPGDTAAAVTAAQRARLASDLDVDICVVGAGLAGLSVALEAARMGASVVVLEDRHAGWNASSHHLGSVMPGYALPLGDLIARVGFDDARELWALSQQGADYVRAHAGEDVIPGLALTEGALEVSNVETGDRLIRRLQMLSEDFETEVEGWQIDHVRDTLRTGRYFHAVHYLRAFQIDGRKYVHGLAELRQMIGQVGLGAELGEIPAARLDLGGRPRGEIRDDGKPRRVAEGVEHGGEVDLGTALDRPWLFKNR